MSTTQKIELSREIRQWVGVGLSIFGIAVTVYAYVAPDKFQKNVDKIKRRFNLQ